MNREKLFEIYLDNDEYEKEFYNTLSEEEKQSYKELIIKSFNFAFFRFRYHFEDFIKTLEEQFKKRSD